MKSGELARSWLPKPAVGGGGGAAVDSGELNEEENGEKTWGDVTFPGSPVRGGDPLVASEAYPPFRLKY